MSITLFFIDCYLINAGETTVHGAHPRISKFFLTYTALLGHALILYTHTKRTSQIFFPSTCEIAAPTNSSQYKAYCLIETKVILLF